MKVNNNPKGLKSGDQVVLEKSNNNIPHKYEGSILTIVGNPSSKTRTFSIETKDGNRYSLYVSGQGDYNDIISFADRKSQAKSIREKIKCIKKELKELEAKAFELEKFETDEDFVAHKIAKILEKGTDEKAIAKLLKTMKSSNLL